MAFSRKKSQEQDGVVPMNSPQRGRQGSRKTLIKRGGKKPEFVMLIGDEGAILVYMEGSKVVRRLFAPSAQPSSTEAMVALMNSHPKVSISLLVDSIDQQYVRQNFPPVSSLSVNGLVKRRLDRDFQAGDLKGSMPLGRDKTGRKEWNFLLISLAKTASLTEWIDLVSDLPNEMKGVYVAPVEGTSYIRMLSNALAIPSPKQWQLLVTHNKISGFRQIVTNQGKLVFTRVSQAIDDAIPAVIAGNIEQEIINTIEYLKRLGFQDASGLDIIVIASLDVNEALDLKRFNLGFSRSLTPLDVAEALGLEQAALSADRFGDVVMASAFLRAKKHVLRFSTAYANALTKLYSTKKFITAITALSALVILGMSTNNLVTAFGNQSQAEESEKKRQALQGQLSELKKSISGLNGNLAFKSAAVTLYDTYTKNVPVPSDFIQELSAHLTPEQRVLSYDWALKDASSSTPRPQAQGNATASRANSSAAPLVVNVNFEFKGSYADIKALAKSVQEFIDMLTTAMPGYTITHDPFPWQEEVEKNLEISFDQQQPTGIKEGNNRLKFIFSGPNKKEVSPAPTAGVTP